MKLISLSAMSLGRLMHFPTLQWNFVISNRDNTVSRSYLNNNNNINNNSAFLTMPLSCQLKAMCSDPIFLLNKADPESQNVKK